MKSMLQQIYRDVSDGRLLPEDALERIRALKLQGPPESADILLATAEWEASAPAAACSWIWAATASGGSGTCSASRPSRA